MFVELFGLPGSGKSTLARQLAKAESKYLYKEGESKLRGIYFSLKHPIVSAYWCWQIMSEASRVGSYKLVRFKLALLFATFAQIQAGLSDQKAVVLYEGMLQRMFSIYETKKNLIDIRRALRFMIVSDHIVNVVGNHERHFHRYQESTNTRTLQGREGLKIWEEAVRHNYNIILQILDEKDIEYFTYDSSTSKVSDVQQYVDII